MINLDSLTEIKKLDKGNMYLSIASLVDQMESAQTSFGKIELPPEYKLPTNIVLAGMGGSALSGRVIRSLFESRMRIPFIISTEFTLPNFVNENSLVILSSYSGNTEEVISAAHDAKNRDALMFGMTAGGKLKDFCEKNEVPNFVIDTKHNPSGQPRMGLGYSILGLILLLNKCGVLTISNEEIGEGLHKSKHFVDLFSVRTPKDDNSAKLLAHKIYGKIPVLISSEHLYEAVHPFKNQLNENAKTFAVHFAIPELDHHLLEALVYPTTAKNLFHFIFFKSKNYSDDVIKLYPLATEVIEKQGYNFSVYEMQSKNKLEEALELLVLGSYVSFYLAMSEEIDPSPIPWVDYFKKNL